MAYDTANKNCPGLPQELVDTIIDHLHDDPTALKQCALVSKRTFLPGCRWRLFSTFEISNKNYHKIVEHYNPTSEGPLPVPAEECVLNTYTTILTFSGCWNSYFEEKNVPKFPKVQRILFKGGMLTSDTLPHPPWGGFFGEVRNVELNFVTTMDSDELILATLCELPERVENIRFTSKKTLRQSSPAALDLLCDKIRVEFNPPRLIGTLGLNLHDHNGCNLLKALINLGDVFSAKGLSYRLSPDGVDGPLIQSLVEKYEDLECLRVVNPPKCA